MGVEGDETDVSDCGEEVCEGDEPDIVIAAD